jgi:hypothetical protein
MRGDVLQRGCRYLLRRGTLAFRHEPPPALSGLPAPYRGANARPL